MIEYGELSFKVVRMEPGGQDGHRAREQLRNLQSRL